MPKHRRSKAKNQTAHFKRRCDERLGVQIDRKSIQRRIRENLFSENFYFLEKQSNRVSKFRYKFQDKWYIIPYDKHTHKVVTIFEDRKQDVKEIEVNVELAQTEPSTSIIRKIKAFLKRFLKIFLKK